jgi:hypothetical protein
MINSRSDYVAAFRGMQKSQKALKIALDTRKFEISLYWQRTAYFWALIAAAFAGYFAVLSAGKIACDMKSFCAFTLSCLGFIFSLAWFLVNRGSKFWQENWEHHVDLLEDAHCGPLYKTVLQSERRGITDGAPVSVSRVNQWVALFTIFIWLVLGIVQLPPPLRAIVENHWHYCFVGVITLAAFILLLSQTKSNLAPKLDASCTVINRTAILK